MPEISNPYLPGQPIPPDQPDLFFGRREVLAAIRDGLMKGRRLFAVCGPPRIGKTSLLHQVPGHLPADFLPIEIDLREEEAQRLDWLLWRLADQIGMRVEVEGGEGLPAPLWEEYQGHPERLLDVFWPQVRAALCDRGLVLLLDDVDTLAYGTTRLLDPFLDVLEDWRDRDDGPAIVMTCSEACLEELSRSHARLFGGAVTSVLGPLRSEEAARLISWPVDGVLTYDYGVPRRLVELTSGQPYYLQLVCHELYYRCAASGWVNQRDLDLVLDALVGREIADFRQMWEESSPQEQGVLAAMVSLRGARGVATVQEVHTSLVRARSRAKREQVSQALDSLTARGILERLGALTYRFRVALMRDWLGRRLDLEQVARGIRWGAADRVEETAGRARGGARPLRLGRGILRSGSPVPTARVQERPTAVRAGAPAGEAAPTPAARTLRSLWASRSRRWRAAAGAGLLIVAVGAAAAGWLWPKHEPPRAAATRSPGLHSLTPQPVASRPRLATATRTPPTAQTRTATAGAASSGPGEAGGTLQPVDRPAPSRTPTPRPTATPSPTPPLVLARPAPSIAYQASAPGESGWSVWLMTSNGSDKVRLTAGQSGFLAPPSWSPDGSRLAFVSDRDGAADIWTIGVDGADARNLTADKPKDHSPVWSPDGEWIAFASVRDSLYWELYLMRPDGTNVQRLTWWEDASDLSPSWSPDGTRLAFASKRDGNWEIYTMDRDGSNLLRLTDHQADDTNPAWSPDGGRIAFESLRAGYTDIFVMPAGGGEADNLTQTSWATDLGPSWSPDGGRLVFYSDRDGDWDVYVMASDGSDVVKLTGETTNDQVPAWRP